MTLISPLLQRERIYGFCHGQLYGTAPNDANITVSTSVYRKSGGSLHVNGQSGVLSSWVPPLESGQNRRYTRGYFKFVNLPSSDRIFWAASAASPTNGTINNFRLKSTGKIELRLGTTVLATSASAFATGVWHQIEVGHDLISQLISLRVNGNVEIDWIANTAGTCFMGQGIGVLDTVAAAFEYYATDFAVDAQDFPGYGHTCILKASSLSHDSANWVNTGGAGTKMAAVDPGATFDDTTYLLSNLSNAEIGFLLGSMPSGATLIHGMAMYVRCIRNAASNSTLTPSIGCVEQSIYRSIGTGTIDQMTAGSTRTVQFNSTMVSLSGYGPWWPHEFWNTFSAGIFARDANGAQVSAFWMEVDYTDVGGALEQEYPIVICDFEHAVVDAEYKGTNSTTAGVTDTGQAKFGSRSLKMVHPAASRLNLRVTMDNYFTDYSTGFGPLFNKVSFWVYVVSRQSSGNLGLAYFVDNVNIRFRLYCNASGGLIADIAGSQSSATANNTIPTGTWVHVAIELYVAGATANSRMKVWVNDVLKITLSAAQATTRPDSTWFIQLGSDINVTGGATVHYDGWVVDLCNRKTSTFKIVTLQVTGSGTQTAAGFTANGAASKWDCLDEVPDDGDTTYVLMATGLGTTTHESYTLTNLAGTALKVASLICSVFAHKRDGLSTGTISVGELAVVNGNTVTQRTTNVNPGAAYAYQNRRVRSMVPFGRLTVATVNALEPDILQASNTVADRITSTAITIGYTERADYPANPLLPIQGIG